MIRDSLLDGSRGDQEPALREGGRHLVHGNPLPRDAGRTYTVRKVLADLAVID